MSSTPPSSIDRAIAAHQAGHDAEAEAAYRETLAATPDDPRSLSLFGLLQVQRGLAKDGLPMLARAVELAPQDNGYLLNLAEGLYATGDAARAEQVLRAYIGRQPGNTYALDRLGDICARLGRDQEAIDAWRAALESDPQLPTAASKLSRLALGQGRAEDAVVILQAAAAAHPLHPAILSARAELLTVARDWTALASLAEAAQAAHPQSPGGWHYLSRAQYEQGRYLDAAETFAAALTRATSQSAGDWATLGGLRLHALDLVGAEAALDRALALDPNTPEAWARRALIHLYFGRFAEAELACRQALARVPAYVPALSVLARVRRGKLDEGDVNALQAVVRETGMVPEFRVPALFALAGVQEAAGNTERAFNAYWAAHAACLERDEAEGRAFNAAAEDTRFARLTALRADPVPVAAGRPRPVFIVGMPRSGTTLVEALLGAHSRVLACGERTLVPRLQREWLTMITEGQPPTAEALALWTGLVTSGLPLGEGQDHFTDKHPLNFENVGLIDTLFPDAAIVHLRRRPLETCLSIYRQEFNKLWTWAHRLEDIAGQYGRYARLMAQWEQLLPGRVIHVDYEAFATDFTTAAPALVERVGLAWEPQCLDFQSAPRAVTTFSAVEAREPVTPRTGRARKFAAHLAPLVAALRAAGVDPETGALL